MGANDFHLNKSSMILSKCNRKQHEDTDSSKCISTYTEICGILEPVRARRAAAGAAAAARAITECKLISAREPLEVRSLVEFLGHHQLQCWKQIKVSETANKCILRIKAHRHRYTKLTQMAPWVNKPNWFALGTNWSEQRNELKPPNCVIIKPTTLTTIGSQIDERKVKIGWRSESSNESRASVASAV